MDPRSLDSFTDVLKITMSLLLKLTKVKMRCLQLQMNNDLVERTKWSVNCNNVPVNFYFDICGFALYRN